MRYFTRLKWLIVGYSAGEELKPLVRPEQSVSRMTTIPVLYDGPPHEIVTGDNYLLLAPVGKAKRPRKNSLASGAWWR